MLGVEAALFLTLMVLIAALWSGYPVGLSLGGTGVLSLSLVALLSQVGLFDPGLVVSLDVAMQRSLGVVASRLANGLFGGGIATIFLAIPLFVLMGLILQLSGVAARLFDAGERVLGWMLPNLAGRSVLVLMLVAVMLAATSGVVGASVSALAVIAYPSLRRQGASPSLASGLVIAAGSLGQIIPPSVVLVLLAVAINEFYAPLHPGDVVDVFDMFWAAVLPGVALAVLYAVWGMLRWPKDHRHGGGLSRPPALTAPSGRDVAVLLSPILLIASVLGTVLAGWATLPEAAVFGVLGAIALAFIIGERRLLDLWRACVQAAAMWSNIALVLVGALVFTLSLKGYGGDLYLQDLARHIDQPFLLLALVLVLFFVLGFFLEFVELTALLIPVFGPVLFASQIDPVWIGVLIGLAVQTSFLTPPMGLSLFYFQAALKSQTTGAEANALAIYRGVVPFVCIQLIVLITTFALLWGMSGG